MAADDLKTERHLTPSGWVAGTSRFFGTVQGDEVERPSDAVATFIDQIYQRSEWSAEERRHWLEWKAPDVSAEVYEALLDKFPAPWEAV